MYERVVEIIMFLVNELKSNKQLSEIDMSVLSKDGYTQSEISTAFSWIFERMNVGQTIVDSAEGSGLSHRVLHAAEQMVISTEAFGYLLQCRQLGLMTQGDIERIIERVMAAGFSRVELEEMKSFVAGLLFGVDPGGPGRVSLGGNDQIH